MGIFIFSTSLNSLVERVSGWRRARCGQPETQIPSKISVDQSGPQGVNFIQAAIISSSLMDIPQIHLFLGAAEHYQHMHTSNPIKPALGSAKLRAAKNRGGYSAITWITFAFKFCQFGVTPVGLRHFLAYRYVPS
jgi:hypothetical protein